MSFDTFTKHRSLINHLIVTSESSDRYILIPQRLLQTYIKLKDESIEIFTTDADNTLIQLLSCINTLDGYQVCWGFAKNVIEIITQWQQFTQGIKPVNQGELLMTTTVNIECKEMTRLLMRTVDILLDKLLDILPAYVDYTPATTKNTDNQPLIKHLQACSNQYRRYGDPKYNNYDNIISQICDSQVEITLYNYKFLKNIPNFIKKNLIEYFNI